MRGRRWAWLVGGWLASAWSASGTFAATTSLVGALDPGNAQDVALHVVTLPAPGNVTIQSWGHGGSSGAPGGTNAQGTAIAAGGFDPYVSVFSGSGPSATFLASNDDGACPPGTVDAALCGDSALTLPALPAGTYTVAVSAFLNMSLAENLGSGTLGDGFVGLGSFGARSNQYAIDIAGPTIAPLVLALAHVPNGLTFGPQTVNVASGPLAVVVTNAGSGVVTLGSLVVGGPDASRYAAGGNCAGTLAPGANCTITVVFTPLAVGPFSASVSLSSNASNAPTTFAVGGTGTTDPVAIASLSAAGIDFGARLVGTVTSSSIVVTNDGGATLQLGYVGASGPQPGDFALGSGCNGVALAPGQFCTIGVDFSPGTPGPRSAMLTIPSDASNGPVTVGLAGAGVLPGNGATTIPSLSSTALAALAWVLLVAGLSAARRRLGLAPRADAARCTESHTPKENLR